MAVREVRRFGQLKDIIPIPSLVQLQANSYERFVDFDGNTRRSRWQPATKRIIRSPSFSQFRASTTKSK